MAAEKPKRKTGVRRSNQKALSVAPGQHLGYTLQETLLTHRLMDASPGSQLSLEVIEDLAVSSPDAPVEVIQVKSALVTNPIADRSVQLWKTLSNWLQLVNEGVLDLERTKFLIYISKPNIGPLAERFSSAASIEDAEAAVAEAKSQFWGKAPRYAERAKLPAGLARYLNAVLEDGRLARLLTRFQIQFGSGSPIADFENTLEKQFIAQGQVKDLSTHALGWIRREIAILLERQMPAVVSRDKFYTEMNAFLRKISINNILLSYAGAPTNQQKKAELPKTYVRQLQLINLDDDDILSAITDFLSASANRAEWGRQGLVHESSFDDLNSALTNRWRNHRIAARARNHADPLHHGQSLYADCMGNQMLIEGMDPPDGFIRGCFQTLADDSTIGWHPDYQKLLRQK